MFSVGKTGLFHGVTVTLLANVMARMGDVLSMLRCSHVLK